VSEDSVINKITCEQYLSKLNEERKTVLLLTEGFGVPDDWEEGEVTFSSIGRYIGKKFRGEPLSEAAIRYIREKSLEILNPDLAKNPKKSPKNRRKS
jgi:hypothetical protein